MSRLNDLVRFIEFDRTKHLLIEPEKRVKDILERLKDVVKTYKPSVMVKIGLGSGAIVRELASEFQGIIAVVEPSFEAIKEFLHENAGNSLLSKIKIIQGDFKDFPVDYNVVDLLVCVDLFDMLETGPVVDEFRRALQFDGILFMAQLVLSDDDLEGSYDELMREIIPLHTDSYIQEDLKTVLDLNDFSFLKGSTSCYAIDLKERIEQLSAFSANGITMDSLMDKYKEDLLKFYQMKDSVVQEPYFIGVFQRRKPKKE